MGEAIRIEKWAENLEEVTVGRWFKAEGEAVAAGEPLCEIITEKVTFEYECPADGVLLKIFAPEKSVVPVGYVIGYVGGADEAVPESIEAENARLMEEYDASRRVEVEVRSAAARERVRATPAARKLARQAGVSLAEVLAWRGGDKPLSAEDVQRYIDERGR